MNDRRDWILRTVHPAPDTWEELAHASIPVIAVVAVVVVIFLALTGGLQ